MAGKAKKINASVKEGPFAINLMRTHVVTAATYGCRVNGMSTKVLEKVCTMVRSATSTRAKGGSATVDMAIQKERSLDPAYMLTIAPIQKWATMAYDQPEKHSTMDKAWSKAMEAIGDCDDPKRIFLIL